MSSNPLLFQVAQKPNVMIGSIGNVCAEMIQALQEGLEEEGIPYEVQYPDTHLVREQEFDSLKQAVLVARKLADASRVNVGLVVSREENIALLHHRDLPVEKPLMCLSGDEITVGSLQILGRNAARLVKGDPFILD
ncbi:glycerol dehydratase reactivase beta/small subunit family protein [Desulforhopalus sp. 52FAK]